MYFCMCIYPSVKTCYILLVCEFVVCVLYVNFNTKRGYFLAKQTNIVSKEPCVPAKRPPTWFQQRNTFLFQFINKKPKPRGKNSATPLISKKNGGSSLLFIFNSCWSCPESKYNSQCFIKNSPRFKRAQKFHLQNAQFHQKSVALDE